MYYHGYHRPRSQLYFIIQCFFWMVFHGSFLCPLKKHIKMHRGSLLKYLTNKTMNKIQTQEQHNSWVRSFLPYYVYRLPPFALLLCFNSIVSLLGTIVNGSREERHHNHRRDCTNRNNYENYNAAFFKCKSGRKGSLYGLFGLHTLSVWSFCYRINLQWFQILWASFNWLAIFGKFNGLTHFGNSL